MGCFIAARFLLTSASRVPSSVAELLVIYILLMLGGLGQNDTNERARVNFSHNSKLVLQYKLVGFVTLQTFMLNESNIVAHIGLV